MKVKEYDMTTLIEEYKSRFDNGDIRAVRSPLRVCPIGAHSDHQGGFVTGMAIEASVNLAYSPNEEGKVHVFSIDFPGEEYFDLDEELDFIPGFWGNYLRGAVASLQKDFDLKVGINGVLRGELPIGGLSSSAAVVSAYLMALCDVNDIELSKLELVKYNSEAETGFMGLKNGILDQSSNVLSKNNHLMVMDCKTNEYDLVAKGEDFPEYEIVVVYSGVTQQLTDSGFNNRTDECRVAGWIIQELDGISSDDAPALEDVRLRDISPELYEKYKSEIPGRFGRRAEHFYTEQERVKRGKKAWADGDIETFGQLMFASGDSTFNNYETGIPEMATIFDVLRETDGVYGARPSGAGFRGSVIGIIDPKYKDQIKARIDEIFPEKHPEYADKYEVNFVKTADGVSYVDNLEELN